MEALMLFTIAIPTLNNQNTLLKAINSAIDQKYSGDYEILVINNASNDSTLDILRSIKCAKLVYLNNETRLNMWENHNRCLELAKGNYVLFLHADDYLLNNALEILDQIIKNRNYPEKYMIWGHSMFNDWKPRIQRNGWQIGEKIVGENSYKIFVDGGLAPSGVCYSRLEFLKLGGFINDIYYVSPNSDSITMIKLAFNFFNFEMVNEIYLIRRESSSSSLNKKTKKERIKINKYYPNVLKSEFNETELIKILNTSVKNESYLLAYYISLISKKFNRAAKIYILKQIIKHPLKNFYLILKKKNIIKIFLKTTF